MLPVTAWPPVRPGYWTSPYGRPAVVRPGSHRAGFPLPKGVWIVRTGANRVVMIIRPPDRNEPYWRNPGTGIVHGMPKPKVPTWPDEWWPRVGWPWAPRQGGTLPGARRPKPPHPPSAPCPPPPFPPRTQCWTLVRENTTGTVFADGQNVRIFGGGSAACIKVLSA